MQANLTNSLISSSVSDILRQLQMTDQLVAQSAAQICQNITVTLNALNGSISAQLGTVTQVLSQKLSSVAAQLIATRSSTANVSAILSTPNGYGAMEPSLDSESHSLFPRQ